MPKISLKTPEEIKIMAEGGTKLGRVLDEVLTKIKPGLSTWKIDHWIEKGILLAGGKPAFKMVPNYYWASCTGINEEVVHSIPKKEKILKDGDVLKIDLGMLWRGFNSDLSWTVEVKKDPRSTTRDEEFLKTGEKALAEAIKTAKLGNRIGHISQKIQETVGKAGFCPVEVLTGHGIGLKLHEEPMIPGVLRGSLEKTPELKLGMTLAIEVIYVEKSPEIVLENDGWTISTRDGKISGPFEKIISITVQGPLILTPVGNRKG